MEINHWARLAAAKLVKDQIENEESDLIIIGHYGGFATYKQDAWSGYAMRMQDFITQVSGVNTLLAGPGILVTNPNGPVTTVSWDGTQGGGTNFNVQPSGPIQVSKNTDPLAGNFINVTNLDTLNIHAIALTSGLNWAGSWIEGQSVGYDADDVVWYEDPDTGVYYTYWAYNGAVPANHPLPTAGQASNDKWARLGLEGPTGKTGLSTAILKLYQWSATAPTVFPTTASVYTWADGSFTLPPDYDLWSQTIPTNPNQGDTLWEITQQYTDYPVGLVVNVTWTTTSPKPLAFFGFSGTDGKSVLSGSGAPINSLGEDGDFYIDTASANYTMYGPKVSGNWLTNPTKDLKGAAGNNGSITYSGAGAPDNSIGVVGDYYIDTTSANYTLYGPKQPVTGWTLAQQLDLKGPQGDPGNNGANGATGVTGFKTINSNYTLLGADKGYVLLVNSASDVIITIDNLTDLQYNTGYQTVIVRQGSGKVTIQAGTNATVNSANNMKILRATNSAATIIKQSAFVAPSTNGVWWMFGDLTNVE